MSKQELSPSENVKNFLAHNPQIMEIELSVYKYRPQSVSDERKVYHSSPNNLNKCLHRIMASLSDDENIAFHSKVVVYGEKHKEFMHIPMIDFCSEVGQVEIDETKKVLSEFGIGSALLFCSGRSFHLYGTTLLKEDDWIRFMGRILLMNLPSRRELVDSRWVGHCLMAGTSRLRWTNNSSQYVSEPKFVKLISMSAKHHTRSMEQI